MMMMMIIIIIIISNHNHKELSNVKYRFVYRLIMNTSPKHSSMARDSKGITHLPATHSRTIPAFTPQPLSITALWLILVAPAHRGVVRLS